MDKNGLKLYKEISVQRIVYAHSIELYRMTLERFNVLHKLCIIMHHF